MKLTVAQLITADPALACLATQPHKGRVAFRIRRVITAFQPAIVAAMASRNSLLTEENSDEVKGVRQIRPEHIAGFIADPLFAELVELPIEPLTAADLEDAVISPAHLDALGPLLKEDKC